MVTLIKEIVMAEGTKERILRTALELFAQNGYLGTSMNDIAGQLGFTKEVLYKHYSSKQEILDSIVERMNQMDAKRAKEYEMPDGDMEDVIAGYKNIALEKIRRFTKVQFLHWTEEEFSCCFRKMLTLEQYREPKMAKLYQNYLAEGPLRYMEAVFSGIVGLFISYYTNVATGPMIVIIASVIFFATYFYGRNR